MGCPYREAPDASVILVLPACDKNRINESYWRDRGAEAVMPLKKNLKRALVKGLEEGPVEAVTACQAVAHRLQVDGLDIAHRVLVEHDDPGLHLVRRSQIPLQQRLHPKLWCVVGVRTRKGLGHVTEAELSSD